MIPLAQLVEHGVVKETALADLRRFDHLINYMYVPRLDVDNLEFSMPESVALLYMPVTLHHAFLEGQRVSQLAYSVANAMRPDSLSKRTKGDAGPRIAPNCARS